MNFVAAKCPQCAGVLQVPDDREIVKCMYCGVDVVVRQAIQLVSSNSKNFLELAKTASIAGNYAEAYNYFTKVLETDPANADAWFGKGTAAGWQSSLVAFRFAEMLVAYDNALKFSTSEASQEMQKACANTLSDVATACYSMSRKHVLEFITVPNSWIEYLPRCRQIISLYEVANEYEPSNRTIIENIIHVCKDNIEGVKYNDLYDNNTSKTVFLSDEYEKEIRGILIAYAEKLKALDPNYIPPNPQRQSPGCFVVTATMGNEEHPVVVVLRSFRDEVLVKSAVGSAFITWYYEHGPAIARRIEASTACRLASYILVVAPAASFAYIILWASRKSR
jgi:tetratricopeptide (TPR) repeat protein